MQTLAHDMNASTWPLLGITGAAAALLTLASCATVIDKTVADAIITPLSAVLAGADANAVGPHMLMTRKGQPQSGDREYANVLASQLRESIARFQDVKAAEKAGYYSFPAEPGPELKEIHYVNPSLSGNQDSQFNPRKPGSLLYRRTGDGGLELVGAMFTAPATASLAELNRRVPLSIAQWHLHKDICIPIPLWDKEQWQRKIDGGKPVFGPESPIDSKRSCDVVGGRFAPVIFGWMTHAYVYRQDPETVWDPMSGHDHGH